MEYDEWSLRYSDKMTKPCRVSLKNKAIVIRDDETKAQIIDDLVGDFIHKYHHSYHDEKYEGGLKLLESEWQKFWSIDERGEHILLQEEK